MSQTTVEHVRPAGANTREKVRARLAAIAEMPVRELQDLYYDLHGRATPSRNRSWLIKRLSYKTQELLTGRTLSDAARQKIRELAKDEEVRVRQTHVPLPSAPTKGRDPRLPPAGTRIRRAHGGEVHVITVLEVGFEYAGRHYRSLSTIAREVTGTSWNGFLWAGLTKRKKRDTKGESE